MPHGHCTYIIQKTPMDRPVRNAHVGNAYITRLIGFQYNRDDIPIPDTGDRKFLSFMLGIVMNSYFKRVKSFSVGLVYRVLVVIVAYVLPHLFWDRE
jgi:hypothetical protein